MKFNIGDRVRLDPAKMYGATSRVKAACNKGTICTVIGIKNSGYKLDVYDGNTLPEYVVSSRIIKYDNGEITPCKEVVVKKAKQSKQWKFESRAVSDIDFSAIANDLSKKNPIAMVEGQATWFVVHPTLLKKAEVVNNLPDPDILERTALSVPAGIVFLLREKRNPSEVVQWAKSVKNANWPAHSRNKATVTVTQLSI